MVKQYSIRFAKVRKPITSQVTKFGGQPVWYSEPQWPVSRATGGQMMFICQIVLDPVIFGNVPGKMAYLFMTDDVEGRLPTMDPEGGENAVIIQPGVFEGSTAPNPTGPQLVEPASGFFSRAGTVQPVEYAAQLALGDDPAWVPETEIRSWENRRQKEYFAALIGNKIGGVPLWVQTAELSEQGPWKLLLQLESERPLQLSLGDGGVVYAFIHENGTHGIFLWQGH